MEYQYADIDIAISIYNKSNVILIRAFAQAYTVFPKTKNIPAGTGMRKS